MFILESISVVVRYFRQGKYWNSLAFRINSKFYFRLKWVFRYVSSKKLQDTFLLKTFYLDTESCHRPQSLRKQKKNKYSHVIYIIGKLTKSWSTFNSWCFTQKVCLSTDSGNENYQDMVLMYISRNLARSLTTFAKKYALKTCYLLFWEVSIDDFLQWLVLIFFSEKPVISKKIHFLSVNKNYWSCYSMHMKIENLSMNYAHNMLI